MAVADGSSGASEGKVRRLCKRIHLWHAGGGASRASTASNSFDLTRHHTHDGSHGHGAGNLDGGASRQRRGGGTSVSSVARSLLPRRRRLRLDPTTKLYFPYEPGKQVRSAVRIKNTSKSHVAFKFQTTAPKSCFMRPPGCILAPGESIIATVFKFVEHPENDEKQADQKSKVKFKIVSLKVKEPTDYVPELFEEQKDQITVEQILRVVFLDPEKPCPQMDKLKRQLAEAEAVLEARKKPIEENGPRIVGEGLVIDEWVIMMGFLCVPNLFVSSHGPYDGSMLTFFRRNEGKDILPSSMGKGLILLELRPAVGLSFLPANETIWVV